MRASPLGNLPMTVAAVAFSALLLELLLARIFPVLLGDFSSFLAVPATMLGLGLGAVLLHLLPLAPRASWLRWLVPLLLVVDFVCLAGEFRQVDAVFGLTHVMNQNPIEDARKIAALTLLMVPPFALTGVVLAVAFRSAPAQIGRLYSVDLAGSALACLFAPLALQWVDLPTVCALQVLSLGVAAVSVQAGRLRWALALLLLPMGLWTLQEARAQRLFDLHPDPANLGRRLAPDMEFTERGHRWNDISRVTLLEGAAPDGERRSWVVHDDGVSRVNVEPYAPEDPRRARRHNTRALPSLLDRKPRSALVIFAGAGRDMIQLDTFARGELDITGIELNGLVSELVTAEPDDPYRIAEFLQRPGIRLLADEGRSFLDRDRSTYDLIYVANNGAQQMGRTGHSRRFLDTEEAMRAYLDHLSPHGTLVFSRQRIEQKVEISKRLLAERGLAFADCAALFGRSRLRSMLIKPSGLSEREVARMERYWSDRGEDWLLFARHAEEPMPEVLALAERPPDPSIAVPTDDRPYEEPIRYERFELHPSATAMADLRFAMEWTKLFTVALYSVLAAALLLIVLLLGRKEGRRLPIALVTWFLLGGIAYMAAQIALMAKLELLLGRPLVSIAVVLAGFLLFNGLGSHLVDRQSRSGRAPTPVRLALLAAGAVVFGLLGAELLTRFGLALPLAVKALLSLVALAPVGVALGTLYPTGVRMTAQRGLEAQIPATFALTALSSVLGSTWAMVAVLNLGFRAVALCALPLYLILALQGWAMERR